MKLGLCGKKLFSYEEKHLLEIKNSDIYFFDEDKIEQINSDFLFYFQKF